MDIDEKVLEIIEIQKSTNLDFTLKIGSKTFLLKDVNLIKSSTPVNQPTKRGGVYFSDKFAYKIKAQVTDLSIVPLLSKSMLGPSKDFQDLEIITNTKIKNSLKNVSLFSHLTSYMQSSTHIELTMILNKIKYE
ncbi:MAG: hypothetical protein ACE5RN_05910 [Nitrosopumilaceae archaeon]